MEIHTLVYVRQCQRYICISEYPKKKKKTATTTARIPESQRITTSVTIGNDDLRMFQPSNKANLTMKNKVQGKINLFSSSMITIYRVQTLSSLFITQEQNFQPGVVRYPDRLQTCGQNKQDSCDNSIHAGEENIYIYIYIYLHQPDISFTYEESTEDEIYVCTQQKIGLFHEPVDYLNTGTWFSPGRLVKFS